MSHPSRLSHAVLQSYDVKRLLDWYLEVTEGHVISEGFGSGFMTYDEEHHRLGITPIFGGEPKKKDPTQPGLVHLAFAWDTLSELLETYARLRDKRIYPRIVVNHGATLSFYYQDPDMNTVELLVDLMPPADAYAAMSSPVFQSNPVGLIMDSEQLLTDVRAERLTPQMLTEQFKSTEVDLSEQISEAYSRLNMEAEEFDAKFEAQLGRS